MKFLGSKNATRKSKKGIACRKCTQLVPKMSLIIKSNTMILQNHSLDHFKSCWSSELGCLPCTLYLNMVYFTCDFYFRYFKKKLSKNLLLLSIHKYSTICYCSKPMDFILSVLRASCWLVMYCTSKMSLQSPDFLSFT